MKIGFYGDSYCVKIDSLHCQYHKYQTYIKLVKNHYNAEVINLGEGGSSYWDLMLKQFPPALNNLPDICIFCWTDPSRIYNPSTRNLGSWVMEKINYMDHPGHILNHNTYLAAQKYFTHLYDDEKALHEALSAFYFFDREVLAPIQDKTKIIHLWSFGIPRNTDSNNIYIPDNLDYIYRWKTGVELRPSLKCFGNLSGDVLDDGPVPNHLYGNLNNKLLADFIIEAINDHHNGKLLTKDDIVEQNRLYKIS